MKKVLDVLLVGCGRIGAQLDWDDNSEKTYAKALFNRGLNTFYYDEDHGKAARCAERYRGTCIGSLESEFPKVDIMVVATATEAHHIALLQGFMRGVPLIICEKPVSNDKTSLELLEKYYKDCGTKVLVNYTRRFLPEYEWLKCWLREAIGDRRPETIIIRYQGGFSNNCSHAIDLLMWLGVMDLPEPSTCIKTSDPDNSRGDKTISVLWRDRDTKIFAIGIEGGNYSILDIEIYWPECVVTLGQCAQRIEIRKAKGNEAEGSKTYKPSLAVSEVRCIEDYSMVAPVINRATSEIGNSNFQDNFLSSLKLSHAILEMLR